MNEVTYNTSGALNRAHFALVSKQERALSSQESDQAVLDVFKTVKHRMTQPMQTGLTSTLGDFAKSWGLQLPSVPSWNPKQTSEDLLLLLYCYTAISNEGTRKLSEQDLRFALASAVTLAEAGATLNERRTGTTHICAESSSE